jgi:hypothetical protein
VFAFQNKAMDLFAWTNPVHTISFLAIFTFTMLNPSMLVVVPIASFLYFFMVPAFEARHPPPKQHLLTDLYPLSGPALAPPAKTSLATELSKDFFRNMGDLQNCMDDYSNAFDVVVQKIVPVVNFSNEKLSTALFIVLFTSCMVLFLIGHLIYWRVVILVAGWAAVLLANPDIKDLVDSLATPDDESGRRPEAPAPLSESFLARALAFIESDIDISPHPAHRQVEIFELQFRPLYYSASDEWTPVMFSTEAHTPLSSSRIEGRRPKGCREFENVRAPEGWRWAEKKWSLDLSAREWVEERCITGVEVEVEGERWVVDMVRNEDGGGFRQGEWRRRRWVRIVKRIVVDDEVVTS